MNWATFDCYGTLIDWNRGISNALVEVWPGEDPASLLRDYHTVEPEIERGSTVPYREVLARSVEAIARRRGLPLAAGDAESLPKSLPAWPPFPEVRPALERLRHDQWGLAVLSNADPDLLGASLGNIGVEFDVTITVAESGSYKPAPGHWTAFFERTRADPTRHLHVAASLFHDIAPCSELGVRAVWINRLQETSDLPRAAELTDLTSLPETLESLAQ